MTEEDRDRASAAQVEAHNAAQRIASVRRLVKAGLTDSRIATVLGLKKEKVTAIRESLGLERNKRFHG